MKIEFKILICVVVVILVTCILFIFGSNISTNSNTFNLNELQAQSV